MTRPGVWVTTRVGGRGGGVLTFREVPARPYLHLVLVDLGSGHQRGEAEVERLRQAHRGAVREARGVHGGELRGGSDRRGSHWRTRGSGAGGSEVGELWRGGGGGSVEVVSVEVRVGSGDDGWGVEFGCDDNGGVVGGGGVCDG